MEAAIANDAQTEPGTRATDLARAEELLAEAHRQSRSGHFAHGWRASTDVATIARRHGDARLLARAATALTGPSIADFTLTPSRQALCIEALAMLGADEPNLRELVQDQLGMLSSPWSDPVALAEQLDPDEAQRRFVALQAQHAANTGPDGLSERLAIAGRIIHLGTAAADDEIAAWGRLWRLGALLQFGQRPQFDAELIEFSAVVARLAAPVWDWRLACAKASVALLEDRLADVPELVERAAHLGEKAGVDEARWLGLTIRSAVARRTSEGLDAIEEDVRRALAGAPFFAQGWRSTLLLDLDRADEAHALWRTIAPHLDALPRAAGEWLIAMCGYAENAIAARDTVAAAWLSHALEPYAHHHVTASAMTPYGGAVSLTLGELSALLGDRAVAQRWFEDALARAESMNSPWFAQRARTALAALEQHGGPLSPRESEVAELVATGRSNREIAHHLHLSERTVEQHVSSALRKLDLNSRSGLTAWVMSRRRDLRI